MDSQKLLERFFAGEISEEEIEILKSWLEKDPEHRSIFDRENELWQETALHTRLESYKTDSAWSNISEKIKAGGNIKREIAIQSILRHRILLAAAAAALLLALGSLSLWIGSRISFRHIAALPVTIMTNDGDKAHILLADSSEVFLNSDSKLEYNGNYGIEDRVVRLSGEAFFDVSSDPGKTFQVQTDQVNITAKGTKFNVLSYENEDRTETTLEEGEIQISIKGIDAINIKPGQQVVFFTKTREVVVRNVATDTYTSWKENKLRFNDTPFEEVMRNLSRRYNVNIEIADKELLSLRYTATFIDESIDDVMKMLKAVSPITYKIYNRTSVNDKNYLNPKIIINSRKQSIKTNNPNLN